MAFERAISTSADTLPEKDLVPKMTSHFEHLAEKANGSEASHLESDETNKREPLSLEEMGKYRATAQQNSMEAIRNAEETYEKAKETNATRLAKDTALEKGHQGYHYASEKALKGYSAAKDYTVPKVEKAKQYAVQKAVEAKDVARSVGETAVHYVEEKAVVAKDAAVVAGWGVAHFTCEKAVEATGKTAEVVKTVAVSTGQGVMGLAGSAKDTAVSSGERAIKFTAKKQEEANKSFEAREDIGEQGKATTDIKHDLGQEQQTSDQGGILGAVGETLVEIAQRTKELVVGSNPEQKE